MSLQILPLAITMMLGPQIMSAIIFVTTSKPVKGSTWQGICTFPAGRITGHIMCRGATRPLRYHRAHDHTPRTALAREGHRHEGPDAQMAPVRQL